MKKLFALALVLSMAACATPSPTSGERNRAEMNRERQEERAATLRDEFNRLTNDAY